MGTLTANLGLEKPTVGADSNQWGTILNQSLDTLDVSVQFGALTKSVAGGVNVTLSADEAAKQILVFTGALTANISVIVPNSPSRRYVVRNTTSGAFTLTVRRASGTGVVIPQGTTRIIFNDTSEVRFEDVQNALNATNATNATTATNVSGGTASVTTLAASGAATLNGGTTTTTLSATGNVTLGDAGTDTTTVNSQVSTGGNVGTNGQVLNSRGANTSPQWRDSLVSQAVNATGTSVNFTGIPNWVKRVTVSFNGVSTNGNSLIVVRIGSGAIQSTGYDSTVSASTANGGFVSSTTGFLASYLVDANARFVGLMTIMKHSENTYTQSGDIGSSVGVVVTSSSAGDLTLTGVLDRVQITTENGTDVFDSGSIALVYE